MDFGEIIEFRLGVISVLFGGGGGSRTYRLG